MFGKGFKGDPRAQAGFDATKRVLMLGILTLMLMLPLEMIHGLLWERAGRGAEVEAEVAAQWGGAQRLAGPVLAVPYLRKVETGGSAPRTERGYGYFLPETLAITGRLATERRHKSVYDVLVYAGDLTLAGTLPAPDFGDTTVAETAILWSEAVLLLGISDMGGVRDLAVALDGKPMQPVPGLGRGQLFPSGVGVKLDGLVKPGAGPTRFSIHLALDGTGTIEFLPMGRKTEVDLAADWPHPDFTGSFLPVERRIGADGFESRWQVSALARNYEQAWLGEEVDFASLDPAAFGVRLVEPGDAYQQADRIGKYGVLVLAFTFATIFVFGVLKSTRTHFVQYLMVGAAIALFYLLLLALAEQMEFGLAYLAAAAAVLGLNGLYVGRTVSRAAGAVLAGLLAVVYGFLYLLLQAESLSLLMGAIGLFVTLALAMYLTRNVDWYALGARPAAGGSAMSAAPATGT
jgi:inner membrane protein